MDNRFGAIADLIEEEASASAPAKRLSVEEEFLTGVLAKVMAMPCQKKLYTPPPPWGMPVQLNCLERAAKEVNIQFMQFKTEFNKTVEFCAVCMVKLELGKINDK